MVDFKAQIQRGLKAHERANADKADINSIFGELRAQLSEATLGKVDIYISKQPPSVISAIAAMGRVQRENEERFGVYVTNRQHQSSPVYKIADWEPSRTGYPCKLGFDGEKIECHDRKSLESALGSLLSSSETGRMIVKCMEFIPPPEDKS